MSGIPPALAKGVKIVLEGSRRDVDVITITIDASNVPIPEVATLIRRNIAGHILGWLKFDLDQLAERMSVDAEIRLPKQMLEDAEVAYTQAKVPSPDEFAKFIEELKKEKE